MTQPNGEVHPTAARFPMLPDDELRELADDIRDALAYARNLHDTAAHGAPQLYDHERQGL